MGDLMLKRGEEIEISEAHIDGSWYIGTVISRSITNKNNVFVEYKTLMSEKDETKPLREKVHMEQLRPPMPRETNMCFRLGQHVDAYHNHGWWEGVITRVNESLYTVYVRGAREEFDFQGEGLRLCREWVKGVWVPPLNCDKDCVRQEESRKNWEQNGMMNGNENFNVANRSVNPNIPDRHVESIDKNWIIGLWLFMVSQFFLAIYMDVNFFYLLLRDEPEQLLYGFAAMLFANGLWGVLLGEQLYWLIVRSEYADDVPWWCYGCTPSTRPRKPSE